MSGEGSSTQRDPFLADAQSNYPHAFFSISDKYIPSTMKEMFRWAQYVFTINPMFAQIVRKMSGYVTTDLVYSCRNSDSEQLWRTMLDRTLKYKRVEMTLLLDLFTYGNSFVRFIYPKQRILECTTCKNKHMIRDVDYSFEGFRFNGKCAKCGRKGQMNAYDRPLRNRTMIKMVRIDPRYIQPVFEPITGSVEYLYSVPKALASRIREGSKREKKIRVILENVPLEVIEAVEKGHLIKFPQDAIYHLKYDSISRDDNSMGDVPFLPAFKMIWLYHTLWRAQEAVSLEHILPWTLLSPTTTAGGQDPIYNINLSKWKSFMNEAIMRWRRDPNFVALSPFAVQPVNLRGDAKALDNWEGLDHLKTVISAAMGVPESFLFGGATYSGGSVELRVLENDFRNIILQLDNMLREFTIPKIARYFNFPKDDIHHKDFKMADDVAQRQMLISMHQMGVVSQKSVLDEFGFDPEMEQRRMEVELEERSRLQREIQLKDAETQAETMKIQAKAQFEANQIMQTGIDPNEANDPEEGTPFGNQGLTYLTNPDVIRMQARNFMATRTPQQREYELTQIRRTNPEYAKAIEGELSNAQNGMSKIKPLPEKAPPRRGPDKAAI